MKDQSKTKQVLIQELVSLRQRTAELEKSEFERKRAEEELSKSEKKYRDLYDFLPIPVYEMDLEANITSANRAIYETFKGTEEDLKKGFKGWQLLSPEDIEKSAKNIQMLLTGGAVQGTEYTLMRLDGSVFPAIVISSVIYSDGKPVGLRGAIIDITGRTRAEEALRESESRMRAITDSAQDAILMMDPEGRISFWNPAAERILGYTSAEAMGRNLHELIAPPRYHDAHHASFPVFQQKGQGAAVGKTLDLEALRKDGKEISVQLSLSAIRMKSAWHAVGILRDVTDRRLAEVALRNTEDRLHTLVQAIPDLIWLKDKDGVYLSCNTMFERFFGAKEAEIVGKTDYDFVDRELADSFREHDCKAMAAGKITSNEEWITFADDRHRVFLDTIKTPMYDTQGTLIGVLGIGRDITNRRSVERIRKALGATVQAIAVIVEARDPYTAGHQRRVADLARSIATEMNLPDDQIDGIRVAATIHDLGKISIPAEILSKPTKLTKTEFDLIKEHSQSGYDILKDIDFPWPVARIVLEHHERMNGSGYPNGLMGNNILLESRIIAIADVVEAMASHRPYRPGLGIDTALAEIEKNKGTHYDKTVADACLRLFREKGYQFK
jgi:PAS domain S-box-containing protein